MRECLNRMFKYWTEKRETGVYEQKIVHILSGDGHSFDDAVEVEIKKSLSFTTA